MLLGQEALVLGLQVDAPADGVIKLVTGGDGLLQDLDGLGVGNAGKVGVGDMVRRSSRPLSTNLLSILSSSGQVAITSLRTYLSMASALSM